MGVTTEAMQTFIHSLSRFFQKRDFGLLILRLGLGGFMVAHGWGKVVGGPNAWRGLGGTMQNWGISAEWLHLVFGFAGTMAEFAGGILLAIGLYARTASFFLCCTMVVAAVHKVQAGDSVFMMGAAWPTELAIVFLALMFMGPGRFAVKPGSAI